MLSRLVPTLLLVAACGVALAAAPPDPLVRPEGLEPVSAHVQIIPDDSVPLVPNVGFVVGSRAVLVVDTGLGPRNGKTVLDVATRLAPGRPALSRHHPRPSRARPGRPGPSPRAPS